MTQFDADTITQRIITNLQAQQLWANVAITGTNQNLIVAIAQEMAYNMQYKEYNTFENWWGKARNKSSLLVESPVHGYKVPRRIGAVGTERVAPDSTFAVPSTVNIAFPKYFQFSNGTTFVCNKTNAVLNIGESYIDLDVVQGQAKSVSFLAQGLVFETKIVSEDSLENYVFDLYVNSVLWSVTDSLYTAGPDDLVYEIIVDPSLTFFTLKFGNGVFGKKLSLNDDVIFYYISTLGSTGNISSINNITTVEDQAYTDTSVAITVYCKNTVAIAGSKDYPALEVIRDTSPKVYQTGNRASNKADYTTIISGFPYIGKIYVWGAYETNIDNHVDPWTFISVDQNVVHLAALNASFDALTTTEKNNLVTDLHDSNDPTDLISFETVEKINLIFNVTAFVKNSSFNLPTVSTAIGTLLQDTYDIETMQFNENIYQSDYVSLIDAVPGVKYHDTTIQILKLFTFTSAYVAPLQVPVLPVLGSSILVYVNSTASPSVFILIATGDANGLLNAGAGYNTTGSSINLTNGTGALVVSSGLTDTYTDLTIKIIYECANDNLLLTNRAQIFNYYSSSISVAYATN